MLCIIVLMWVVRQLDAPTWVHVFLWVALFLKVFEAGRKAGENQQ